MNPHTKQSHTLYSGAKSTNDCYGVGVKIGRKLPEPIKKSLSRLYYIWTLKIDKNLVRDLAEYSNLNQKEVIWLLKSAERLNKNLWYILNPKTEKEIEEFYSASPFYIFELAFWHMKKYQRQFRANIVKFAQGRVLDFGGGLGDLSLELIKKGFDCDYADIYGRTFKFAEWLFQKRNCRIEMIDLSSRKISKEYDTIYCIDVIEHFSDSREALKDLTLHLKDKGRLIITNLNAPVLAEHPMHFPMKFDGEKYLNSLGLFKSGESWLWIKGR